MKIKTRRYYIYYLAVIGGFFIAILPLKLARFLADLAGRLAFSFGGKEKKRALENMRFAFPEKTDAEIRQIARQVFSNLCRNAVEWIHAYKLNKKNVDKWIESEDFEKIDLALSKGKGIIILSSHFGNWELASFCYSFRGYRATAIVRRIYFNPYDRFINRMRKSKNVNVVYRGDSPRKFFKILRNNESLGILADQDMDSVDGVFVDFFGKPAYTPTGPVQLSMATGAPIIPCFVIWEKNKHRLILEDPIVLEAKETKEETIKYNTQKWSRILESYVRKYPDHWVWMHRKWKTTPEKIAEKK